MGSRHCLLRCTAATARTTCGCCWLSPALILPFNTTATHTRAVCTLLGQACTGGHDRARGERELDGLPVLLGGATACAVRCCPPSQARSHGASASREQRYCSGMSAATLPSDDATVHPRNLVAVTWGDLAPIRRSCCRGGACADGLCGVAVAGRWRDKRRWYDSSDDCCVCI